MSNEILENIIGKIAAMHEMAVEAGEDTLAAILHCALIEARHEFEFAGRRAPLIWSKSVRIFARGYTVENHESTIWHQFAGT